MAWPASQDFNEAIQDPASAFRDPDLRGGQPAVNPLGLPMPRSGNFADVYEMRTPGHIWAVKCFTREVHGLRERYQEVSACLRRLRLPFMVDFHFLDEGIRVRGQWYPIVKMDWVEGLTLNEFVRRALGRPGWLDTLAQVWLRLARKLQESRIAHADLQHGNILLVHGSKASSVAVKLIDYDGMLVPRLANKPSGEVGHPAYQHPERFRTRAYCPEVDRFPNLVIFCALRALLIGGRPLWERYDNGDNLLFRQKDLESPETSALFEELLRMPDGQVRQLAMYLRQAARLPLLRTPCLPDVLGRPTSRPVVGTSGQGPAAWSMPTQDGAENIFAQAVGGPPKRLPSAMGSRLRWRVVVAGLILATAVPGALWLAGILPGTPLTAEAPQGATVVRESKSNLPVAKTPEPVARPVPSAPRGHALPEQAKPQPAQTPPPSRPGDHLVVRSPVPRPPRTARGSVQRAESVPAIPMDPRLAIPDDQARAKALADLHQRYQKSYDSPDAAARAELARSFLEQAEEDTTEPVKRYVLLEEAGTLAAGAEDLATGLHAAKRLGERYRTDTLAQKVAILTATAGALRRPSRAQAFVPQAATLADELTTANRYVETGRVLEAAIKAARLANLLASVHALTARLHFIRQLAEAWQTIKPFWVDPRRKATDPVAREAVGRFLCLAKGDWGAGLDLLAEGKGGDAALRNAAALDRSRPDTAPARRQLANAYRTLSDGRNGLAKLQLARRAVHWYHAALLANQGGVDARTISEDMHRLERLPGFHLPEIPGSYHRLAHLNNGVVCLATARDGLTFVGEDTDARIQVYDVETGHSVQELEPLRGQAVEVLAFSPTGRKVLGSNGRGFVAVWDVRSGGRERAYRPTIGPVHHAAWAGEEAVVTAGILTWFQRVGADDSREIKRLPAGTGNVTCLASSADGKRIALGTTKGVAAVYTAERPTLIAVLTHARGAVEAIAFSADGKRLVAAYSDRTILGYELRRPVHGQLLARSTGPVQHLAVAPDGRRILWTTDNRTLHYADGRTRKEVVRLEGQRKPIRAVAFLSDGQHAISADESGEVLRWALPGE